MTRDGVMWLVVAAVAAGTAGCASLGLTPRVGGIQSVVVGDTMAEVRRKAGPPDQILAKQLTPEGARKEVWLYDAIKRSRTSLLGVIGPSPEDALATEREYQLERANEPPHLIVFVGGKVAEVARQY